MSTDPLSNTLRKLIQQRDDAIEALRECEEYFDNRADAEYFTDDPAPQANEEMRFLHLVRTAIRKAEAVSPIPSEKVEPEAEGASV